MHVFFESVWKLHIGEIPEKPVDVQHIDFTHPTEGLRHLHVGGDPLAYENRLKKYNAKIAAIKQNALTVGNPEFLESHFWCGKFEHLNLIEIPPPPDKFYFWPGGYETKEIKDGEIRITAGGHPFLGSKTVAIITLPEEKKNTMENTAEKLTKLFEKHNREFRFDPQVSHRWIVNAFDEYTKFSLYKDHPTTASGSVAAPKEEEENETLEELARIWIDGLTPGCTNNSLNKLTLASDIKEYVDRELATLRQQLKEREEALKELLPIAEQYRTKIDNPNWEDDFNKSKAIIERARKLLHEKHN